MSVAGGVSVAYVFTHILGDVQAATDPVQPERHLFAFFVHEYVYLFALFGLVVFYGVERFVKYSGNNRNDRNEEDAGNGDDRGSDGSASDGVFWAHIGLFVLYNAFLGYVFLHHETVPALLVFVVAVALHLSIVDADMREKHGAAYRTWGRWLLAGAVLVGTASGYLIQVSDVVFAALFAFLGGAILLNVFRGEFPERGQPVRCVRAGSGRVHGADAPGVALDPVTGDAVGGRVTLEQPREVHGRLGRRDRVRPAHPAEVLDADRADTDSLPPDAAEFVGSDPEGEIDARIDPGNVGVYVCGIDAMCNSVRNVVEPLGVPELYHEEESYG